MKNSKSEYRNPKQYQNLNIQNSKRFLRFWFCEFKFVSNFVLRASNFRSITVSQRGVALLPMILVLFGLVAVVGIAIAGISVSESTISSTKDASDEALVIAESGIQDALMKLARGTESAGYSLPVSGGTATITISNVSETYTINSTGALDGKSQKRKIQVIATVDANRKITQTSWQELAP